MANKSEAQRVPFEGLLNLNKYRNEIRNFDGFNKKNSPIYGGVLSPLWERSVEYGNDTEVTFVDNDEYTLTKGQGENTSVFSKNGTPLATFDNTTVEKTVIEVPYNILAIDRREDDSDLLELFVEYGDYYAFVSYNLRTKEYALVKNTYKALSKISKVEMRYGVVVYYDYIRKRVVITTRAGHGVAWQWEWLAEKNLVDNVCFSVNKLPSFIVDEINAHTQHNNFENAYLVSLAAYIIENGSIYVGYGNYNIAYNENGMFNGILNIKSSADHDLPYYQVPQFALNTNGEIRFYNHFMYEMRDSTDKTFYLSGTIDSYEYGGISTIYLNCENGIGLNSGSANSYEPSLTVNPWFYSTLIKTKLALNNGGNNVLNHHVLFDSTKNYFVGNCGYIPNDNGTSYVPYGFKANMSEDSKRYKFSALVNYGNISNISLTDTSETDNVGTVVAEWNYIDGDVSPKVVGDSCLYKISNENTVVLVELKEGLPSMDVVFDRYIVFKTPMATNVFDTKSSSFYHGFVDYNNRVLPCERYGATSIQSFPYKSADTEPFTLTANLKDYLYASAVNANMEVSKINLTSIQYNPSVVNNGNYNTFDISGNSGNYKLNECVDLYITSDSRSTVPTYYGTLVNDTIYKSEALRGIAFPVTKNGNILYSANLFSEIINSYSNKDMIVNDTVTYPIVYINNQPSFSFYFLNGIEGATSAFVLHGMNYVNTSDYIFSVSYNGDTISNTEPIVSIRGFKFLGNTTKAAFFYSELKKSVFVFYGDRTLDKLYDCTEVGEITRSFFNPINYNIYISTNDAIYVIDENTNYKIDIKGARKMYFSDKYIFVETESKAYFLAYENIEGSNMSKIPIELETQYYGVGNNIKSVVDCVYLRLFKDNVSEQGKLSLGVSTLTDKGTMSESKDFLINPSDWDKETDTFYIRYQPKNQECVGISVKVKSDFPIADFNIGHMTDGTLQVSKFNA